MDEFETYKNRLRARITQLIDRVEEGSATKDYVAFETLWSVFSAFEDGRTHEEIKDAYPLEIWREDTVTLPRAIVRRLADGWGEYRSSDASKTLGNSFKLEGGQGKSPVTKTNKTLDAELRRSNKVLLSIASAVLNENDYKQDAIFQSVAEEETKELKRKVSAGTIKKAYLKHGKRNLEQVLNEGRKLRDISNQAS